MVFDFPRFFPNLYIMATPTEIEGAGNKNIRFHIGDKIFATESGFNSQISLNELDLTLYYDVPLVKSLTQDMLNIDLGLNVRAIDFNGNIENEASVKRLKASLFRFRWFLVRYSFTPCMRWPWKPKVGG